LDDNVTLSALPIIGTYNQSLVALSVLIAFLSSYAALDLVAASGPLMAQLVTYG
jgi:NO-binding membrane sensor protein with MHYT domain